MLEPNNIYLGDCLEFLQKIEPGSVDAIIADPPYGTTACNWDTIIPLEPMWAQLRRIIKQNGAIVLMASQPFTSRLVMSNLKNYRHQWIWNKNMSGNPLQAKRGPLKNLKIFWCFL